MPKTIRLLVEIDVDPIVSEFQAADRVQTILAEHFKPARTNHVRVMMASSKLDTEQLHLFEEGTRAHTKAVSSIK
jgi:hypothetical protein